MQRDVASARSESERTPTERWIVSGHCGSAGPLSDRQKDGVSSVVERAIDVSCRAASRRLLWIEVKSAVKQLRFRLKEERAVLRGSDSLWLARRLGGQKLTAAAAVAAEASGKRVLPVICAKVLHHD